MESNALTRESLLKLCTVCMYCNRQRTHVGRWCQPQTSLKNPTSHGICPACYMGAIEDLKYQIAMEITGNQRPAAKVAAR